MVTGKENISQNIVTWKKNISWIVVTRKKLVSQIVVTERKMCPVTMFWEGVSPQFFYIFYLKKNKEFPEFQNFTFPELSLIPL